MLAIYKPTAKDTEKARNILKDAGIKISVRKVNNTFEVGRQCELLDKETSLTIIRLLETNGFKLCQSGCIYSLIEKGLNDNMSFWVVAK